MRRRWPLVVITVLLVTASCGDDGGGDDAGDEDPASTTSTAPPVTAPSTTAEPVPATDVETRVYFSRDGQVATAGRSVEPPAVARGAVEALLAGPDDLEAGLRMTSSIPAGTRLIAIHVEDGLATVDLSGEFLTDTGDGVALRVAQVVFTLTQYPTVDRVTVQVESVTAPLIGVDAVPVIEVDRSDFAAQTPLVLVESPTPGETVTSPIRVTGMSNTFEATVAYEVADAEGTVVDEGFTTATAGTGTWGTFDLTTGEVPAGGVVLRVFQSSPEDGRPTDLYEVPVTVG